MKIETRFESESSRNGFERELLMLHTKYIKRDSLQYKLIIVQNLNALGKSGIGFQCGTIRLH